MIKTVLFELEQRLARIGGKLSAEEASALIAEDFVEIGASGKIWSKADITPAISEWPANEATVEDFRVRELGPSVCLVTYKLIGVSSSLRSSIWRHSGNGWQMIFHQGTQVK